MLKTQYLLSSLKARGIAGTLKEFSKSYIQANVFVVLYKNLQSPAVQARQNEKIAIKKASLYDLDQIRASKQLPVEFYCDKSHNFTTPFLAFVNGQVAAIHWVVTKGEYSRFLNLGELDIELNYNIVLPQYRGERLAELLMANIIESYTNGPFKRIFGVVNAENVQQYKPMLRLGFEPVEALRHYWMHRPKATLRYVK